MELHPILECGSVPQRGLWYVLSSDGSTSQPLPSMRVGHTATQVGNRLYVIGGANPSGAFPELYILNLDTFTWQGGSSAGMKAVYEHTAFVSSSDPTKIYVFGGADQHQNYNAVMMYDTVTDKWSSVNVTGTPPSPRTFHNGACVRDCLIVYSGGHGGTDPVGDRQTYSFDLVTRHWSVLGRLRGDTPKPRLGHMMVEVGQRLYVHGGMAGSTFYDDLHVLDLSRGTWSLVKQQSKDRPPARAGHAGFTSGKSFYIFGGMNKEGALNDMYCFNTETMKWSRYEVDGPLPAPRLDYAVCNVRLMVKQSNSSMETTDQIVQQGEKAREVLEEKLRIDSAGSNRSASSAGSQRSVHSISTLIATTAASSATSASAAAAATGALGCGTSNMSHTQVVDAFNVNDYGVASCTEKLTVCHLGSGDSSELSKCQKEGERNGGEERVVDVVIIHGGMDAGGEIFDDCLLLLLNDKLEV